MSADTFFFPLTCEQSPSGAHLSMEDKYGTDGWNPGPQTPWQDTEGHPICAHCGRGIGIVPGKENEEGSG